MTVPPSDNYPVFQNEEGWFFYDETWSDANGPYDSETEAQVKLMEYCTIALGDLASHCRGARDGECSWKHCPQIRDGEPHKTRRHCPLDRIHPDE